MNLLEHDIICAISTANGIGGIAVLRLSGSGCIELVDNIFKSASCKKLKEQKANTIHFGEIWHENELIDDVLVSIFKSPHSFTGEESVEISCHGSLYIQQRILRALISIGARLAKPGEFTQRAYFNGKMDLSQAEAVADLISSSSHASHKMAMNQMKGGFARELLKLREELLEITSLLELELDFSEEDVEFADRKQLLDLAYNIKNILKSLCDSFSTGNAIKEGIPVAIVGHTNVGKSTLLNALLKEDRAIVSNIAGTTRDVIEDTMVIGGLTFRFIDTAGIRSTTDIVESIGINKAYERIEKAKIVLFMLDATERIDENIREYFLKVKSLLRDDAKLLCVVNKCDLSNGTFNFDLGYDNSDLIYISAKNGININSLTDKLISQINLDALEQNSIVVSNIRHYEALSHAYNAIERVIFGLGSMLSGDFISQDIRECIHYLSEVTGAEITSTEVLSTVFSRFCIGK